MGINFTQPLVLLLLPVLLLPVWQWWRSTNHLPRWRKNGIILIRTVIFLALVLALAGLEWRRPVPGQTVIFAVDLSASVAKSQTAAASWIREAMQSKGRQDSAGIVVFGREALVEQPVQLALAIGRIESVPEPHATDLQSGLRLAEALLPEATRKRIILLSDGLENAGNAQEEAARLAARGIRLDTVALQPPPGSEVALAGVRVPGNLREGERFPLEVTVQSTVSTNATLRVFGDRRPLGEQQVRLQPGENTFSFAALAPNPGFHTYRAVVEPDRDTLNVNNEAGGFATVSGRPQVLVVEGQPGEAQNLAAALKATGVQFEVKPPAEVPRTLLELRRFASVVLVNVPAMALSEQVMTNFKLAVRDLGLGLVMIGGEESYGPGGYFATPVEEALPVRMDLQGKGQMPSLGLMLVIDKSGSMGEGAFGAGKMELAVEAGIRATTILSPQDSMGVVAFDELPKWVVPFQKVGRNKGRIQDDIATIRAGGGTNIYPGVALAYDALQKARTKLKHIILVTDGMSAAGGDYDVLAEEMRQQGVTLSAVAVGGDSDTNLLEYLAKIGRGRYYFTEDFETIPKIFTKETMLASRNYLVQKSFYPAYGATSPIFKDINNVPPLKGYVATTPKPLADQVLVSPDNDPVLATWQYGLGRTAAWTSDSKGRWSAAWLVWDQGARFWANLVNWTIPVRNAGDWQVETRGQGTAGQINLSSTGLAVAEKIRARIVGPDLTTQEITLTPTLPGSFSGEFATGKPGTYLVEIVKSLTGGGSVMATTGLNVAYSPEFAIAKTDKQLLKELAQATGGSTISDPGQAFTPNLPPVKAEIPLWNALLILATLLLPLDVALRRLNLGQREWAAVNAVYRRLTDRTAGREIVDNPLLNRLKGRKEQVGQRFQLRQEVTESDRSSGLADSSQPAPRSRSGAASESGVTSAATTTLPASPLQVKPASEPVQAIEPSPVESTEPVGEADDLTSRLLAAKKRAGKK